MRFGEQADPALGGARVEYATVDATPLFVMLVGELLRFGVAQSILERLEPYVEDAVAWMRKWGDLDGDGFVEYDTQENQGWRHSADAIRFADGRIARRPIALCEVQGYAYAAFIAAAELREHLGSGDPDELRLLAGQLRRAFREAFYLEDQGFFALALDSDKAPVDAISSNPGHLLWTAILGSGDARAVAGRLLRPDCFSGFGIRTLSSEMAGYNPLSYHNGSVWPHDNAIAIAGMMRYGLVDEAAVATKAMLKAATGFGYRLPELFAGFSSEEYASPVPCPTACSPQACAAGAPFLVLRALLGLEPELQRGRVYLDPHLPPDFSVEIAGLRFGEGRLSFRAEGTSVDVEEVPPDVEVVIGPRPLPA
jgi:glycogen debranching enzyme